MLRSNNPTTGEGVLAETDRYNILQQVVATTCFCGYGNESFDFFVVEIDGICDAEYIS